MHRLILCLNLYFLYAFLNINVHFFATKYVFWRSFLATISSVNLWDVTIDTNDNSHNGDQQSACLFHHIMTLRWISPVWSHHDLFLSHLHLLHYGSHRFPSDVAVTHYPRHVTIIWTVGVAFVSQCFRSLATLESRCYEGVSLFTCNQTYVEMFWLHRYWNRSLK